MAEEPLLEKDAVEDVKSQSIQARGRGDAPLGGRILLQLSRLAGYGDLIPPWWSTTRDIELRRFWKRVDHLSGAINTFTDRIATVPFRIEARDKSVRSHVYEAEKLQEQLLMASDFGESGGWQTWVKKFVEDLITQDNGAFAEVVGPGKPDGPVKGQPIAPTHLDSARCMRTGDPEYPVLYTDLDGSQYKLHYTRVMYASQMPSPRAEMYNVGFCAVSRCVNVAQTMLDVMVYKQELLGSRPQRQLLVTKGGLDPEDVREAFRVAEMEMTTVGLRRYSKTVVVGDSALKEAGIDTVNLSALPEGFDEQGSTVISMAVIALAFGVDARELFPAMSIGATRADALIQHLKQRGKGFGHTLALLENLFNFKFLPPTMRMVFDFQDDAQDQQAAEIHAKYAEGRNANLQNASTSMRIEREHMMSRGEVDHAQFVQLELESGRLEDGTEAVVLFFDKDYKDLLDLKGAYKRVRGGDPEEAQWEPGDGTVADTASALPFGQDGQPPDQNGAPPDQNAEKATPFDMESIPATEPKNGNDAADTGAGAGGAEAGTAPAPTDGAGPQEGETPPSGPGILPEKAPAKVDWEDPLNKRVNDPELMLDLIQVKLDDAYKLLATTPSSRHRSIDEAVAALKALAKMYGGGDTDMGSQDQPASATPPQLRPFTGEQPMPQAAGKAPQVNPNEGTVTPAQVNQDRKKVQQENQPKELKKAIWTGGGMSDERTNAYFSNAIESTGLGQLVEETVGPYDDDVKGTIRTMLVSKIHQAFTVAADQLMQRGYLTETERINLSSRIGETLKFFNESIDPSAVDYAIDVDDMRAIAEKMATVDGKVAKGGPGSGNRGHAGRPGQVGGSAPSDDISIDIKAEENSLMNPWEGNTRSPKEGVTRDQMQRYYNRRDAIRAAEKFEYKDGTTARQLIEQTLREGFTKVNRAQFGYKLTNPDTGVIRTFKNKEERDFIDTLLEYGNFEPNYEVKALVKGGPGSGFHGHQGRPGEIGGSASEPGGGEPQAGDQGGEGGGTGGAAYGHAGAEGQVGSEASGVVESAPTFDVEEWRNKDFKERQDEWNAMTIDQQDKLANAPESVPALVKERLAFAGEQPNTGDLNADISTRLDNIGEFVHPDSREQIQATCEEMSIVLQNAGVSPEANRKLTMMAVDQLAVQENEAMRRQLGDHGINHIRGNIAASMQILNEVPGADPAEEVAAMYVTHVFHDAGYLTGPSQVFLDKPHPRWGMQAYDANIRATVAEALGERKAGEISHYIRTHAETDIDWQNSPIVSSVRVSDNMAIFKDEKLPGLYRFVPENVAVLESLAAGNLSLGAAKSQMRQNVQSSNLSDALKQALTMATNELSPVTPKFTLGMLGGRIDTFEWAGDHLLVNLRRNAEATRLQKLFDLGQRQFAKFAEVFGVDAEQFSTDLDFTLADETGNVLLEGRVFGEKSLLKRVGDFLFASREPIPRTRNAQLVRLRSLMERAQRIVGGGE